MLAIRRQLSLFVPPGAAAPIEALRRVLDPVQHALVPAHVTLAREDELAALDDATLRERLAARAPLALRFGAAESFDGHGLLLPCVAGEPEFHALRAAVLGRADVRAHRPHLTLAHPRNPHASGNTLERARSLADPGEVVFREAHLIEQAGAAPWVVRAVMPLGGARDADRVRATDSAADSADALRIELARTPEDFAAVRVLMHEYVEWDAAQTAAAGYDPQEFLDFYYGHEDVLPGPFAPPEGALLLARVGGEPAGCGGFQPIAPGVCELKRLFVRPSHRGLRAGRRMAEQLVALATAAGHHTMRLETTAFMREAHALYASLGFRRCEPYYDIPDALLPLTVFMERRLRDRA